MADLKEYMTTAEAADELGITIRGVQKLIERGQLPTKKMGPVHLIRRGDLNKIRNRKRGRPRLKKAKKK